MLTLFRGDGYTKSERKKFFADVKRMTDDLFKGETFKSILPILNVWAVFTPSKESGIGVNGKPKDTVFGLYRDGTELRGIYPTNKDNARKACRATGPYACDYPVIIGNDDYYGSYTVNAKLIHLFRRIRRRIRNQYIK
jgi:hypothetical protein